MRAEAPVRAVLSTSSAFGGMNAAIVLGRSPARLTPARHVSRSDAFEVRISAGRQRWTTLWPDAPRRVLRTHRYVRLGLLTIHRLLEDVGGVGTTTGVVVTGPSGCISVDTRFYRRVLEEGPANASRVDFAATVCTAPAAEAETPTTIPAPESPPTDDEGEKTAES